MSITEEMIFPVDINEEVRQSFLDYSVSVITDRALPDVRDGMKPVHRRVLYGLHTLKMTNNKPHSKSARLVGEVLGKFHPHSDTSVYDTMVRLAQDFSLNYPLVDGHGNYGNIDGDSAAAMRYTETRLSKVGESMLQDIDKDTIDWKLNFAEDEYEPTVLPARLPQLLINGTTGIAVGMAASFVPGNLGGTVEAIERYINNNDISVSELLKLSGGPDFPTGGLVINKDELLKGYETGRGRVRIRGRYNIEKEGKRDLLVFYEIPYMTRKSKIAEDIAKLAEEKEIEGIVDVRDESAKDMRLIIEVKQGFSPDTIAEILFAKTQLENTYSINNTCLVDGQPKTLSYKQLISHYVKFQQEIITRRTQFDLNKVLKRKNIVEGLIIALANIDDVIKIIKESNSSLIARENLMKKYELNEEQAKSVLAMRLSSLTRLEIEELKKEKEELEEKERGYRIILNSEVELNKLLVKEMRQIAKPYISKRRTEITNVEISKDRVKKLTKKVEDVHISIDVDSIISFTTAKQFKSKVNRENSIYQIETNTAENLIVFMSGGRVFRVPVEELQPGDSLKRILNVNPKDDIINILTSKDKEYVIFLTEKGMVKKTELEEYSNIQRSGVMGIKLESGDNVVSIDFLNKEPIFIMANDGQIIRFHTKDITPVGRAAKGVKGIKLNENAKAISLTVDKENSDYIITVSKNGMVKKTPKNEFSLQGRNGKGVIGMKLSKKDEAHSIINASEKDKIIAYGTGRIVKSEVKDISTFGRNSMGNILMKDSKVTNVHLA